MKGDGQKTSFGEILSMALTASIAIGVSNTLKIGGMFFTGFLTAAAALLGLGIYRLLFTKFKASNLLIILCSSLIIVVLVLSINPRNRSVLTDNPTPQPSAAPTVTSSVRSLDQMMIEFNEKQDDLVKIPEKILQVKNPYLEGKVVFYTKGINLGETDARWIFDSAPAELGYLIAETPDDVKTVVLKVCKQVKLNKPYFIDSDRDGKKEKEIKLIYWSCDLSIINRTLAAVIFKKTFDSKPGDLFQFENNQADIYEMPMPNGSIDAFLKKLTVKKN
jgi:hypothetical protein